MAIPAKNILGNPNVTEGSFQIAIEQLRESVIGSGKVYDSANTYMIKDTCEYSGVIYYSKINNNIGNTPSVGANWGDYADLILGVVHKTGNETIAGVKTFSSSPIVPNATTATQVMAYGQGVNLTAAQTIAGVKTFSDNVGIGVTPSAWGSMGNVTAASVGSSNIQFLVGANAYYNSGYKYASTGIASQYEQYNGIHTWKSAPSGTAGSPITWTNAMTLDASGNLLIGVTSLIGGAHTIFKGTKNESASGDRHLTIAGISDIIPGASFYYGNNSSIPNASNSVLKLGTMNVTNRSISAAGTINASGADYAEYEYSNDITLVKGQIVGFKEDGTLTDKYNEAIRFAIKSTNPSIVGGDVWGAKDVFGKRPEQPVRKPDKTEQVPIKDSEEFETVVIEAGDTDAEWEAIEAKYKTDLADFEARLEVERQKVDRIAYAGKVPVNVYGAAAGQYIVAIEKDGEIDGLAVNKADMTFVQYQDTVGRVNKILEDGRAEVAVIIH